MSSNLEWLPVDRKGKCVSDDVKFILRRRYGHPIDLTLDSECIGYLEGLKDAGVNGAEELIKAIDKHGEIVLKEVF